MRGAMSYIEVDTNLPNHGSGEVVIGCLPQQIAGSHVSITRLSRQPLQGHQLQLVMCFHTFNEEINHFCKWAILSWTSILPHHDRQRTLQKHQ